jgi:hypothetical protein
MNHSPHVVILGAGASYASFPDGDSNGRKLPLMSNLIEVVGLNEVLEEYGYSSTQENFEAFYDKLATEGQNPELLSAIEEKIYDYFSGMELPDEPTLYDYLILSLRKTDVIATFNWDPFLAQAYRRNMHVTQPPNILFLHGNVEIGTCIAHGAKGFHYHNCNTCGKPLSPSKLLYPVKHKNYQADGFINNEWEELKDTLEHAYFVTVFGYSAPKTDIEAKTLLLDVWKNNPTKELAEIEIIDIQPKDKLLDNWRDFIIREHYSMCKDFFESYLTFHPRRSCDAFAMATLQQSPWRENKLPKFSKLSELHEWIQPLLKEEEDDYFTGNPC